MQTPPHCLEFHVYFSTTVVTIQRSAGGGDAQATGKTRQV